MAMVVQHNIQAMNANRQLGLTVSGLSKSAEKLSSGYRINRAADDAAGLTISEKMRKQMRGLDRASTNAQDGISSVQTAEGALTEVHDMLQRMNELATQAANGTNSESDRNAIQDEVNNLLTEIDRVAETTKFNEIYLLKGDPTVDNTKTMNLEAHDAGLKGVLETDTSGKKATFTMDALEEGQKINIGGIDYTVSEAKDGSMTNTATAAALETAITADATYTYNATSSAWEDSNGTAFTLPTGVTVTDPEEGDTLTVTAKVDAVYGTDAAATGSYVDSSSTTVAVDSSKQWTGGTTLTYKNGAWEDAGTPIADMVAAGFTVSGDVREGDTITVAANGSNYLQNTTQFNSGTALSVTQGTDANKLAALNDLAKDGAVTFTYDGTNWQDAEGNNVTLSDYDITATNAQKNDKINISASDLTTPGKAASITYKDVNPKMVGENIITKDKAYDLIKDELKKANDIGTGANAANKSTVSDEDLTTTSGKAIFSIDLGSIDVQKSLSFQLHVGADADMTNKIGVKIETMNTSYLGIKNLDVIGSDTDNGITATYAIDAIQDAISKVSAQRSSLGAVQNRLEHTVSNLDNVVENTTAAESRIRDTDMAEEMVRYSKNNILQQAGQSMLAQANQSNQGVLSLLG